MDPTYKIISKSIESLILFNLSTERKKKKQYSQLQQLQIVPTQKHLPFYSYTVCPQWFLQNRFSLFTHLFYSWGYVEHGVRTSALVTSRGYYVLRTKTQHRGRNSSMKKTFKVRISTTTFSQVHHLRHFIKLNVTEHIASNVSMLFVTWHNYVSQTNCQGCGNATLCPVRRPYASTAKCLGDVGQPTPSKHDSSVLQRRCARARSVGTLAI